MTRQKTKANNIIKLDSLETLLRQGPNPPLIIFDLDYTLWSSYIDCTSGPPYTLSSQSQIPIILDNSSTPIYVYKESLPILKTLHDQGVGLGVASRSETPDWARIVLELMMRDMGGVEVFEKGAVEICPRGKTWHFERFRKGTGVEFGDMVFFDDEMRNVREVGRLGVVCEFVEQGVGVEGVVEGIRRWRKMKGVD